MATARSLALPLLTGATRPQRLDSRRANAPVTLEAAIHPRDSAGRAELEGYIHDVFARGYGAEIKHFLPQLMSLRDGQGELLAALGMRCGNSGPLFLEHYLDEPVEQRLAAVAGVTGLHTVRRDSIVEIGNLASSRSGAARWLFLALAAYLHGRGAQWAIFTVAPFLKNTFIKLGFNLHILAKADKRCLGDEARDWGSYYDAEPEVMAVDVAQAFYAVFQSARDSGDESLLQLCSAAYDLGVRKPRVGVMENILSALCHHAQQNPSRIALRGSAITLSYSDLNHEVGRLALEFVKSGWRRVALMADNSPAWAVIDLAAAKAGVMLVPLPAFFSDQQLTHALVDAGIEGVITDQPQRCGGFAPQQQGSILVAGVELQRLHLQQGASQVAPGIAKITYTSGTTAAPKGVMLDGVAIDSVSRSLALRTAVQEDDLHLCLLPLATLLENIGGLYVPLLAGAAIALPSLAEVGMVGASSVDITLMVAALERYGATRAILLPQLLQALVERFESGVAIPSPLRFLAVGGAPLSVQLLQRAAVLGLPLFQGYGLSECCSVVALNNGAENRPGSVGKPLPHVELRIAADGEILVKGALFSGYLSAPSPPENGWWHSGDEGYLDEAGYLFITGRRKNIFITSFGRNVAPEWVEQELVLSPVVAQAYVYGEARPWNIAVLVTSADGDAVQAAINEANSRLPDYARIREWLRADAPFTVANGQLTATGRLRRQPLWQHYGARIEARYSTSETTKEVSS